jgi:hypothetical protein
MLSLGCRAREQVWLQKAEPDCTIFHVFVSGEGFFNIGMQFGFCIQGHLKRLVSGEGVMEGLEADVGGVRAADALPDAIALSSAIHSFGTRKYH